MPSWAVQLRRTNTMDRAAPQLAVPNGARNMKRRLLVGAVVVVALFAMAFTAAPARADEWSKTYTINGRANLRVGTDDGDVTIVSADQKQIDARVATEGYKIGATDVRI